LWQDIREGFRYVWRVPLLRLILIVGTIVNFLLSPLPVIIPLFFKEIGIGAAGFGSALSVILAGFLVGVAYMGVRGSKEPMGALTVTAMTLAGLAASILGVGPHLAVILVIGLIGGAAIGAMEVAETTILQRESTDEFRGRVFALYESVSQGGRAISVALAGGISEVVGLRWMFYSVGAMTLACAVALWASPTVRRLKGGAIRGGGPRPGCSPVTRTAVSARAGTGASPGWVRLTRDRPPGQEPAHDRHKPVRLIRDRGVAGAVDQPQRAASDMCVHVFRGGCEHIAVAGNDQDRHAQAFQVLVVVGTLIAGFARAEEALQRHPPPALVKALAPVRILA
jgi:hypothetical protein